jgi:hypothetical protein
VHQVVAGASPGQRGGPVGAVVVHRGRLRGEQQHVDAALVHDPQLVRRQALQQLVVGHRERSRRRPVRVVEVGQLGGPEIGVGGRGPGEVAVAVDDHASTSGSSAST